MPPHRVVVQTFLRAGGDEGTTLATIGDQRLTVEAMEKKINASDPVSVRQGYQSKERRKEYIEHLMDKSFWRKKRSG